MSLTYIRNDIDHKDNDDDTDTDDEDNDNDDDDDVDNDAGSSVPVRSIMFDTVRR
jgi:hypothetical protein